VIGPIELLKAKDAHLFSPVEPTKIDVITITRMFMKRLLLTLPFLVSFSAYSQSIQLNNLSKDDVEDVSVEFGGNFAHTAVAAPETDGAWGLEIGVVGGKTKSPNFSDVIKASGGNGSDFESVYHAGAMARVHLPGDLFAEVSLLPEQEIDDVKIKSQSFSVGWNLGGFFNLPVDVAIGFDHARGEVNFHQDQDMATSTPEADVKFKTKTNVYWVGLSKSFWIVTPYVKAGTSTIEGDLRATGQILGYTASNKANVSMSGSFLAGGVNFQLGFIKLGVEASQIQDARRFSGKLSFDF